MPEPRTRKRPRAITQQAGRRRGHPSVLEEGYHPDTGTWDPNSRVGIFIAAMQVGNYQRPAAEYAGIGITTITQWLKAARQLIADLPKDDDDRWDRLALNEGMDRMRADFLRELTRVEAQAEVQIVTLWRSHMPSDWKAAERFLAKRHPDRWGDKGQQTVEVVGNPDQPVQVATTMGLDLRGMLAEAVRVSQPSEQPVDDGD